MARQKPTPRAAAWIEILSGVESVIEKTLGEADRRETGLAPAGNLDNASYAPLAQFSERFQGLWLCAGRAEKQLGDAEAALAEGEKDLRGRLDDLVACRQNLAQWLGRAVG